MGIPLPSHDICVMKHNDAEKFASRLREAELSRMPIEPIVDEMAEPSLELAYAVQAINVQMGVMSGRRQVGCKIGLTNPAVQRQLGVGEPDFGILFADMAYSDGQEVDATGLIQPKAEGEVALVLEHDLIFERHTVADLLRATAFALPALEIVDSRIRDWKISIYDTVADNASSALFVLGTQPVNLRDIDLGICGMSLELRGEPVSTGNGSACLGHPLNAALWLTDTMVRMGNPLRAGDIILTGALGPMVALPYGETLTLRINGLGTLRAPFKALNRHE